MKTEIKNVPISSQLVSCDKNINASERLNSPYNDPSSFIQMKLKMIPEK